MAFPANPSDGEIYNKYKWSSSVNAWMYKSSFGDNFEGSSLNSTNWSTFGESYGSIVVNSNKCIITNNSGSNENKIGIYSNISFPIGSTIVVKSKNTGGRHAALIGFGEPSWWPYPHYNSSGNVGLTWYSRADVNTSNISGYDENGLDFFGTPVSQDLTGDQVFTIERISASEIKMSRNGIVEYTTSGVNFSNNYPIYFSADAHTGINTIEIDWVMVL